MRESMRMNSKKRIGILTGGGDVPPLNAVISAAQQYASLHDCELVGFVGGWQGVLENRTVPLQAVNIDPRIGGTVLKSSRVNLVKIPGAAEQVRINFNKRGLQGLVVVGGEDTLSNSLLVKDIPQVLISKTIDNDVGIIPKDAKGIKLEKIVNYFTLGYPTAARLISRIVSQQYGVRTTAYSHERIMIVESMGMHAGWLALASTMGDPDFIVIPEFPLDYEIFKEAVARKFDEQRHVVAVIAEGAKWKDGSFIAADEHEKDSFGHPRFKGSAAVLAERLKRDLKNRFNTRNVNSINPSYLYRSGEPESLDLRFGKKLGSKAVELLTKGSQDQVFLTLKKSAASFELKPFLLSEIQSIESLHRFVDETLYSDQEFCATDAAKRYLSYIVPEIRRIRYGLKG